MNTVAVAVTDHLLFFSCRRDGDLDGVNQIYALLAAFGESHSRLLLDAVLIDNANKEHVLQLVQIMLDSTGTPGRYPLDEHCSHLAFSFWYYYPIYDQLILNNHLNSA